jgi:hypothetical protein
LGEFFKLFICLSFLLFTSVFVYTQSNGVKTKRFTVSSDTLFLDSLTIIAGSVEVFWGDQILPPEDYFVELSRGTLLLKRSDLKGQSLLINYRTFPFSLSQAYFHKSDALIRPNPGIVYNPFKYRPGEGPPSNNMSLSGLDKSGSITRGVGFGNNSDVSVNSSMNLQVSGRLSDNLNVLAAINDENIPIQPDGNTQQLQDFDQVYVQVFNKDFKLTAGDFRLESQPGYFMRYIKRAQGISALGRFYIKPVPGDTTGPKMDMQISGAFSRGKFARNQIQGIEGNQGPYRLQGAENEPFIIILSGTERVYVDGRLLERGQENDYIINYNTAELSFTARQLITKDRRIVVEFQYTDQNYARSLVQFSDRLDYGKLKVQLQIYSEQDAKNQSLQQSLSDEQKNILRGVGDSLQRALAPGYSTAEFSENEVLYAMVDTLGYDSVFVYSVDPALAKWRVSFSKVGEGRGNYVLADILANGRVYKWVEPLGGVPQGTHAPVVLLYTPKQKQMFGLGLEYALSPRLMVSFDGALSNNDLNTFSEKDNSDNIGHAFRCDLVWKKPLNDVFRLHTAAGFERWDKHFTELERVRSVEFYRDWNLQETQLVDDQHISKAELGLDINEKGAVVYQLNSFISGREMEGYMQSLKGNYQQSGFILHFDGSLLNSSGTQSNSSFDRHRAYASQKVWKWRIGYEDYRENNLRRDAMADTLLREAYSFWERELFWESADSQRFYYRVFGGNRHDFAAAENDLQLATYAEQFGFLYDLFRGAAFNLKGKSTYRTLRIQRQDLTPATPDENILSRIEYSLRVLKSAVTANAFYEIGSGLEARKEYSYVEVPAGQGVYTWRDYNDNGIKELNEFEVAAFQDEAEYIRIFITTNEYVKGYNLQFSQALTLSPERIWYGRRGWRKVITAFSNQSVYRVDRKTGSADIDARFNPLPVGFNDSQLVALNASLRNTFYFQRTHPVFGADWTYQDINGRTLLTNGYETRRNEFHMIHARLNFLRMFTLEAEAKQGIKRSDADFAINRDFTIDYQEAEPKLSFQPGAVFRITMLYGYKIKENRPELGSEKAEQHKAGLEIKLNQVGKGSLTSDVNFIQISYNTDANTAIAFEMLDALLPGNNATWNVGYQRTLGNNLQLNLSYNGRKSETADAIHAGSVRMRAFF